MFTSLFCILLDLNLTYRTAHLAHTSCIYILVVKINIYLMRFSLLPLTLLAIQRSLHVVIKPFVGLLFIACKTTLKYLVIYSHW